MRTIQYGLVNSAMGQIPCSTERISCCLYLSFSSLTLSCPSYIFSASKMSRVKLFPALCISRQSVRDVCLFCTLLLADVRQHSIMKLKSVDCRVSPAVNQNCPHVSVASWRSSRDDDQSRHAHLRLAGLEGTGRGIYRQSPLAVWLAWQAAGLRRRKYMMFDVVIS